MTSKLEYLQRYISNADDNAVNGDKKKKRKKKVKTDKKVNSAALGTHVVDVDDAWEQSAPSREDIDKKWELEAAEDEQPMVVAEDGDEVVDIQDLPVYVDSDKYLNELQERKREGKVLEDEDLSPPRKKRDVECRGSEHNDDDASPLRRPKIEDASPPRRRPDADQNISKRQTKDDEEDILALKKYGREHRRSEERSDDVSPPRRPSRRKRDDDVLPSRRDRNNNASPQRARDGLVSSSRREDSEDTSPPRRSHYMEDGSRQGEQRRRHLPSRSPAAPDRQRRVDSLGRDIPSRPSRNKRQPSSPSKNNNSASRHRNKTARSRSNSRGGDRDMDRSRCAATSSRRGRRSRSRSPRARRCDSRSPSVRRHRSPRKSTRWSSPRRDESTRGRSYSLSRGKHRLSSPSQRSHSRSISPKRRLSEVAKTGDHHDADKGLCTAVEPPLRKDIKSKNASSSKPNIETHEEKEEKKAGLFTAAEFDRQRKSAAKQKDVLHGVDAAEMGANAKTVYRDKRGRKLDMLNEMVRQQEVLDGKRKREEREEYEWGTGAVQKQDRKSQLELVKQMKNTPFARHVDDEELERKRRERVRAFDPLNSKIFQEDPLNEDKSKKTKKRNKDKKMKRKYAGPPAPPNRFGIMPGYRWDGVVRGTNWEEKIMMRQNTKAAVSEEAYKYAVADM
ncbi:unnamed protein product [Peronospora belbahrii]|uniref:BUD13 homolog n=1 Tax=Peronospora belbahrii TaxID=622444 RepID=A0ABN8D197_9STRA|nr:unnamed protein product [Peronospora belbahrii]